MKNFELLIIEPHQRQNISTCSWSHRSIIQPLCSLQTQLTTISFSVLNITPLQKHTR